MLTPLNIEPGWLRKQFPSLVTKDVEPGQFVAYVPGIYEILTFDNHEALALRTARSLGRTNEESIENLSWVFIEYSMNNSLACLNLRPGQTRALLKESQLYELVHEEDPRHHHEGPGLLDFVQAIILPSYSFQLPFDRFHGHLLLPKPSGPSN